MKTITLEEVLYHLSRCYEAYVIEQPLSTACVIDLESESFLEIQAEDDEREYSWSFNRKDNPTAQVEYDVMTLMAAADVYNEAMPVQLRLLAPVILDAEESYSIDS